MKKNTRWFRFAFILIVILSVAAPIAWADGETGTVSGYSPGKTVKGTMNEESFSSWGGTIHMALTDGPTVPVFCTDIPHPVNTGDTFEASEEEMDCRVKWLMIHYPPRMTSYTPWPDGAPGTLSDRGTEMAARQAAVWHFSDGLEPDDTTAIGQRALEIIQAVPEDACAADAPDVIVSPASAINPVDATQTFTVTVTRGGTPVADQAVALAVDQGTLSAEAVTTDDQGQATFTLTHGTPDTNSHITATAEMLLSAGTIFIGTEPNKQKLVLGEEVLGSVQDTATANWTGTGTVTTLSFDDYNMNEEHDSGEPRLEGWTMKLYKDDSGSWDLIETEATDSTGTAQFTGLSAGDYRIEQIQPAPDDWYATTPLEVEFTLGPDESRSFSFGQIKLPIIIGHVFQDDDLDGAPDAEEPALEGWELRLYRQDGSFVVGMQGTSDEHGKVIFSSHPDRDPPDILAGNYFVQETLEEAWYATTGISQTVTLSSGDINDVWLGNVHPEPTLDLEKTGPAMAHEGDTITYVFTATNTGNVPLTDVTVEDPLLGGTVCELGTLEPEEEATCEVDYTVPAEADDPLENTATASASEPYLDGEASHSATFSTDILHPTLDVNASGPAQAHEGDELTYEITLDNTGDTPLDVVLPLPDGTDWTGTIEDGASVTFDTTATVPAGSDSYGVDFTATGTDPLGGETTGGADVSTDVLHPAIEVSKSASADTVNEGESVEWSITVYNRGDTTLYDVTVSDSNGETFGPLSLTADDGDDGDGGDQHTWTYETYPTDDVLNQATASGADILDRVVTDDAQVSVSVTPAGDNDGDGTPDYQDDDDDGDNIPDEVEGAGDADGDGTPNFLDADADGDNIPDGVEGAGDADGDGTPNFLDADADGDNIPDEVEGAGDADGDGTPNFLDLDSDGDNIPDGVEGAGDADGDGTPNFLDLDSDGDNIPDGVEGAGDADGDGTPNFLDLDSDGDTILDQVEGAEDTDGDGTPNFLDLDSDGDGITDADEWSAGPEDPLAGCTADDPVCYDNDADGDGTPNFLDPDSDDDGTSDEEEGTHDSDGDGIPDWLDPRPDSESTQVIICLPLIVN